MRTFRRRPGRLAGLPTGSRLIYTIYLGYALVALVVASLVYLGGPSLDPASAAVYYAGSAALDVGDVPPPSASDRAPADRAPGGPSLELGGLDDPLDDAALGGVVTLAPGEASADVMSGPIVAATPINARRLLETTHGHLFVMPLFFLVIAHVFVLIGLPPRLTGAVVGVAALAIGAHIAAPWLIRDVSPSWSPLLAISGIAMLISLGGMAIVSLVALWRPVPPTAGPDEPGA